ncbi:MAG TPA: gluconate 2-dehydrogenase subunit 3 family protein, partial [Gemmatimonadetes bacterium]|nr:gluconate 2-dehydrogenase subunit 3 family protein [Gemmatimonadota bacterium]
MFFTSQQRETIEALSELIIPTTDTPGAITAEVPEFIELIVAEWYDTDDRERFMRGLTEVDERTQALAGVVFAQSGADAQA